LRIFLPASPQDELYCLEPEVITNWFEHCLGFEQDPSPGTAEEIRYATGYRRGTSGTDLSVLCQIQPYWSSLELDIEGY